MTRSREARARLKGADMVRKTKRFWIGLVLLVLGPALRAGVDVGYDTQADFSRYKTYGWKEGGWQAPKLMTENRIHKAVEQELEAKGIKKTEGEPDLLVVTYASSSTTERVDAPSFGGIPNTWTGWSAATTVRGSSKGSLKVDLIDRRTSQLVWRGLAAANMGLNPNAEKTGKKVLKVVKEMFEDFPPAKKN